MMPFCSEIRSRVEGSIGWLRNVRPRLNGVNASDVRDPSASMSSSMSNCRWGDNCVVINANVVNIGGHLSQANRNGGNMHMHFNHHVVAEDSDYKAEIQNHESSHDFVDYTGMGPDDVVDVDLDDESNDDDEDGDAGMDSPVPLAPLESTLIALFESERDEEGDDKDDESEHDDEDRISQASTRVLGTVVYEDDVDDPDDDDFNEAHSESEPEGEPQLPEHEHL